MGCDSSKQFELNVTDEDISNFKLLGLSKRSLRKYMKVFEAHNPKGRLHINLTDLMLDWAIDCSFNVLNLLSLIGIPQYMNFREVCNIFYTSCCSSFILISNLI